jgi:hypothetical protein
MYKYKLSDISALHFCDSKKHEVRPPFLLTREKQNSNAFPKGLFAQILAKWVIGIKFGACNGRKNDFK